jgi:hypothetical protein
MAALFIGIEIRQPAVVAHGNPDLLFEVRRAAQSRLRSAGSVRTVNLGAAA